MVSEVIRNKIENFVKAFHIRTFWREFFESKFKRWLIHYSGYDWSAFKVVRLIAKYQLSVR